MHELAAVVSSNDNAFKSMSACLIVFPSRRQRSHPLWRHVCFDLLRTACRTLIWLDTAPVQPEVYLSLCACAFLPAAVLLCSCSSLAAATLTASFDATDCTTLAYDATLNGK